MQLSISIKRVSKSNSSRKLYNLHLKIRARNDSVAPRTETLQARLSSQERHQLPPSLPHQQKRRIPSFLDRRVSRSYPPPPSRRSFVAFVLPLRLFFFFFMDALSSSSPARSPALPPRGAPIGGKTCPLLHHGSAPGSCAARAPHLPHQPLPPMPALVLARRAPPAAPEKNDELPPQQATPPHEEQELPNEDQYEHSSVHGYVFNAGKRAEV